MNDAPAISGRLLALTGARATLDDREYARARLLMPWSPDYPADGDSSELCYVELMHEDGETMTLPASLFPGAPTETT